MEFQRERIWNAQVHTADLQSILSSIDTGIVEGRKGRTLYCANPHSLVVARNDKDFFEALDAADTLVPDGIGIVLASKLLGGSIVHRVTGSDVMVGLAERWKTATNRSYFFLGSSNAVLEKMRDRMSVEYPNISVSGVYAPPFANAFSHDENERMIESVNRAAPTVLWVGMTAPKQEKWVHENRARLNVPLIGAVGAAFDYFAGTKRRASSTLQQLGLEWLPRLVREPRRMWRRNFISTPIFLYYILQQRISRLSDGSEKNPQRDH